MTALRSSRAPHSALLAAALPALSGAGQPRSLAHGASGPWDEVVILALFLVIAGAVWLFVRSGGDEDASGESGEPPRA